MDTLSLHQVADAVWNTPLLRLVSWPLTVLGFVFLAVAAVVLPIKLAEEIRAYPWAKRWRFWLGFLAVMAVGIAVIAGL